MKYLMIVAVLTLANASFAAEKVEGTKASAPATDGFKLVDVAQLSKWMKNEKNLHIYDANVPETRAKSGLIPGAKPLPSVSDYDTATVLPSEKDAKLVFYCGNESCRASHDAAKHAVEAGYKDVNVMSGGIEGWKKAGKRTEKLKKQS